MALVAANLEKIGGGLRQLFIYYATADTVATVTGSGYFNNVYASLNQYDVIIVIGNSGATVDTIIVSSASKATTVTTVSVEGVTAT